MTLFWLLCSIFTLISINLAHFCYWCYEFYKIYALSNKMWAYFVLLYFERVLHITVVSALSEVYNLKDNWINIIGFWTMKKIMINACAEIITLKSWWSPAKNWTPGADNSNRTNTENAVPIIPAKIEKIK